MNNFHNSGAYASFFYANFHHKLRRPMESHRAAFFTFDTISEGAKPRLCFYICIYFFFLFCFFFCICSEGYRG